MITVGQATKDDVHFVMMNARERDVEEIAAVSYYSSLEDLAKYMAGAYGDFPGSWCYKLDGEPVCVITVVALHPKVWSIGMIATPKIKKAGKFITWSCVKHIFMGLIEAEMHRLECRSIVGYDSIHKWLRFLGFQEDTILQGYGKDGQDFILFSWVKGRNPWPKLHTPPAD